MVTEDVVKLVGTVITNLAGINNYLIKYKKGDCAPFFNDYVFLNYSYLGRN